MATRKQRYDIALNSQGLILDRHPELPRILARQDAIFGNRFAQGDRGYNDLAKWWFMSQTDWSGGFKNPLSWADDAKFYYSTNIDTWSEPGAFKLALKQTLQNSLSENIRCGGLFTIGANTNKYLGTADNSISDKPIIYKDGVDISSGDFPDTLDFISQLSGRNNIVWSHATGTGSTYVITTYDGTTLTDQSANISDATVLNWTIQDSFCGLELGTKYYAFVTDGSTKWALVSTTADEPSGAGDWTKVLENTGTSDIPISCGSFNGKIYYFLFRGTSLELRVFDPSDSSDTFITIFYGITSAGAGIGNKLLLAFNDVLIITVPAKEIWQLDLNGNLTRIYLRDDNKNNIGVEAVGYLSYGGLVHDGKVWWGNLIYDGTYFHNWIKDGSDSSGNFFPLFVDQAGRIWGTDTGDQTKSWQVNISGSYKGTADENYIVFSNFDKISGIDKLSYALTIIFKTLESGQKITVEYTTGELTSTTTWTDLGNADYSADGAITTKTFFFGDAVTFKKLWFRAKLEGGGSNTPSFYDHVFAYLPMPDYKLEWKLAVKCIDEQSRKDQTKEPKTALWIRNYLQQSWLTKSILSFEDYDASVEDYVSGSLTAANTTITVQNSTDGFPEIGRLLIDTEEIFYTGKTKTTFTGCTRGARGTNKATHSDGTTISMNHRVIIRDYQEELILANDPNSAEYVIQLTLSEV